MRLGGQSQQCRQRVVARRCSCYVLDAIRPTWQLLSDVQRRDCPLSRMAILRLLHCLQIAPLAERNIQTQQDASALGFLDETHAASVGGREAVTERYQAAKERLEGLQTRLAPVAKARPAGVVEAGVIAGQHDPLWASSKGCTNATIQASRAFCRNQELLKEELKASREAAGEGGCAGHHGSEDRCRA
jgi:hypothetical protein